MAQLKTNDGRGDRSSAPRRRFRYRGEWGDFKKAATQRELDYARCEAGEVKGRIPSHRRLRENVVCEGAENQRHDCGKK
jgi:hypothetical protein